MNSIFQVLNQKLKSKSAKIGVVGLGYVGLPLSLCFSEAGYPVIGFDIDESKIKALNEGKSYIQHIPPSRIQAALAHLTPTAEFKRIQEVDAIILCVPTPLNKYREPDLSYILNTMDMILPHIREGQVLSLESTTYPGTTEEEIVPRIEKRGFKVGENYFVVYSPEREDPGRGDHSTRTIPKVCGGFSALCSEVGVSLYESTIDRVVPVSSTRVAEMTKLLENIHRAVNIGLMNELKVVAERMNIDIYEVIKAAATKPFGFVPYYPGPGLGGHCIPIDPFYLTWKAREYGCHTRFIELAGEINDSMPQYVMDKLTEGLNHFGKAVSTSKILVLGIAYKKNIEDVRESPSVKLMELIRDKGAVVHYSDPHVVKFPKMREHHFELSSVVLNAETLEQYDAVILATDHDGFDYGLLSNYSKLLVDTRGKITTVKGKLIRA
jgi:UDP-N-acetyl-D-glucosamine dehydrogenase